jgi:hypothetical protein
MDHDRFEAERRRLHEEMQAAIEEVRETYRRRLAAIDHAEKLMDFAVSGGPEPAEPVPAADAETVPLPPPGPLGEELARYVAGRSEPFSSAEVEARFPGAAPKAIRTLLAQMAKDGKVRIVEPGESGRPTRYETPEPDYAGVPPRPRGGDPS